MGDGVPLGGLLVFDHKTPAVFLPREDALVTIEPDEGRLGRPLKSQTHIARASFLRRAPKKLKGNSTPSFSGISKQCKSVARTKLKILANSHLSIDEKLRHRQKVDSCYLAAELGT